jgi:hypothetical protein
MVKSLVVCTVQYGCVLKIYDSIYIHGAETRLLLPYAACRTWAESSGVCRSLSSQAPESSHVQIHQRMRGGRSRERERDAVPPVLGNLFAFHIRDPVISQCSRTNEHDLSDAIAVDYWAL